MIDMHYDILSVIYQCYLRNDFTFIEKWAKNYNSNNVSGLLANLYFMNEEEMMKELGDDHGEINVLEMFRISTQLFEKYFPDTKVIYSIEGCDFIKDTHELEELYKLGLRNILLVWNNPNRYGSGNRGDYGLTEIGREFLIKAIELGISIDLSHMNSKTFYDTIELLKEQKSIGKNIKVIASHSNSYEICPHERNLTDQQFLAMKEFQPVIGLVSFSRFVFSNEEDLEILKNKYLEHIERVVNLLGINCVGVSTDDMGFGIEFFSEKPELQVFDYDTIKDELTELLKKKYNNYQVERILYKNIEEKLF